MHEISFLRRAAVWPVAAFVRLWAMTVRLSMPAEDLRALLEHRGPILFAIWHNRLFMGAQLIRRYRVNRPTHALISASRDGAWLAAFFSACGLRVVRGSSSRMGREAARQLVDLLHAGRDVGITPDGPRGPVYEMKPGVLIVARRARATVVLIGVDYESSWRLPSWDGFHIPKPFSRAHIRLVFEAVDAKEDRDEGGRRLGALLAAINPDRRPAPVRRRG